MFIARQLKETNIAEYLLYMWQIEDMIRANGLDPEKIDQTIISQYQLDDDQKKEMTDWYSNLISMMREEGVTEKGHLQINNNVILELTDLHNRLLSTSRYPYYTTAYYKALPFIVELRNRGTKDKPELETCFEALYGVLLLKLQKKPVSAETVKAIEAISTLIAVLTEYYYKDRRGELEISNE